MAAICHLEFVGQIQTTFEEHVVVFVVVQILVGIDAVVVII